MHLKDTSCRYLYESFAFETAVHATSYPPKSSSTGIGGVINVEVKPYLCTRFIVSLQNVVDRTRFLKFGFLNMVRRSSSSRRAHVRVPNRRAHSTDRRVRSFESLPATVCMRRSTRSSKTAAAMAAASFHPCYPTPAMISKRSPASPRARRKDPPSPKIPRCVSCAFRRVST